MLLKWIVIGFYIYVIVEVESLGILYFSLKKLKLWVIQLKPAFCPSLSCYTPEETERKIRQNVIGASSIKPALWWEGC